MPNERKKRIILGLTGPLGSGVTTVSEVLASSGRFHRVSVAALIKEKLRQDENVGVDDLLWDYKSITDWRKRLQDIGNEGRRTSLHFWVEKALAGAPADNDIVIDGIRNAGEVDWLRQNQSNFFLAAVVAPDAMRWERVQNTYQKNLAVFERDDERDQDEENSIGQQVEKCVLDADYVLRNDTKLEAKAAREAHLFERLKQSIDLFRGVPSRTATPDEVHMATAYAQSHMSRCLKRFVGSVIVSDTGVALSLGYNENPIYMKPCELEYTYCFKDNKMIAALESMEAVFCPTCGTENEEFQAPWICIKPECRENLKAKFFPSRNMELCTAIHAEERAIRSLHGRSAENSTMYVTTFPCFQCARYIIDARIARVVYVEAYPVLEAFEFLTKNNVKVEAFQGIKARAFNQVFRQRE